MDIGNAYLGFTRTYLGFDITITDPSVISAAYLKVHQYGTYGSPINTELWNVGDFSETGITYNSQPYIYGNKFGIENLQIYNSQSAGYTAEIRSTNIAQGVKDSISSQGKMSGVLI